MEIEKFKIYLNNSKKELLQQFNEFIQDNNIILNNNNLNDIISDFLNILYYDLMGELDEAEDLTAAEKEIIKILKENIKI